MALENEQSIQQSILQSIDYLINDRVSKLELDKTIICSIVECTNSLTGEYKVHYQDGSFLAYSSQQEYYVKNDLVYVLVPLGNFSNNKIIVGKATVTSNDEVLSTIDLDKYKYKPTSKNCLKHGNLSFPIGLNSYKAQDGKYLYYKIEQHQITDNEWIDFIGAIPKMSFDEEEFKCGLQQSNNFWLSANFRTNLSYSHKLTQYGRYGLAITFAFKKENAVLQIADQGNTIIEYYNLEDIDYRTYILDSEQMIGNPFRFQKESNQHIVYEIPDVENYLYLKSVQIYSKDFELQSVIGNNDIFFSDLSIYTVNTISNTNTDYNILISLLDGNNFSQTKSQLRIQTSVYYQQNTDISKDSRINYYWFQKDDRINSYSENYSYLAGARWKKINCTENQLILKESECLAYENEYKVIVNITDITQDNAPQIILYETFKIYNLNKKHSITLESSRGVNFNFRNGNVTVKCLIDGRDGINNSFIDNVNNSNFSFYWSKTSIANNNQSIVVFDKTLEELQEELQEAKENYTVDASLYYQINREIENYNNTIINKNIFETSFINEVGIVELGCTIYQTINNQEYYFGSSSITFSNGNDTFENGYLIEIINGNQLFQYDEMGFSPAGDRLQEPQILLPLDINFYSPEGVLISKDNYTYKWLIPRNNTLFDFSVLENNLKDFNEEFVIFEENILPINIKNEYDYSALNNQLKVVLIYNEQIFNKETSFTFLKIGDNGTNGSNYVGKIVSKYQPLNGESLSVFTKKDENENEIKYWNVLINGSYPAINTIHPLAFQKFFNGEQDSIKSDDNLDWKILGNKNQTKFLSVENVKINGKNEAFFTIQEEDFNKTFVNQIVKGSLTYLDKNREKRVLNAFLGIPYIRYYEDVNYTISFNEAKILKNIVYDNDGSNPHYNKNQGFDFTWDYQGEHSKFLSIEAQGGKFNNQNSSNFYFKEGRNKNTKKVIEISKDFSNYFCELIPVEFYDGEWFNNNIHGRIYSNKEDAELNFTNNLNNCEVEFWIPIIFLLNNYGMRFLNEWDGTHLEINEDGNYILAPQIGAGQKNKNNTFTGIVMGIEKQYNDEEEKNKKIGLLGYCEGQQSIFLDAQTGKVELGVSNNDYGNGRIILDPKGESSIGTWKLGEKALYNVQRGNKYVRELGDPYNDNKFTIGHEKDIKPEDSGILISASPPYISVKGSSKTVNIKNSTDEVDYDNNGDIINPESLELQIDPNQESLFSIFSHYKVNGVWKRQLKVGIDSKGRFFANSLKNSYNNLNISNVDGFGEKGAYVGFVDEANLNSSSQNLVTVFKAFIDKNSSRTDSNLYLSGGNLQNEYARPLNIYGKEIYLRAQNANTVNDPRSTYKEAENTLTINDRLIELAHRDFIITEVEEKEYDDQGNIVSTQLKKQIAGYAENNEGRPKSIANIVRGIQINKGGNFNLIAEQDFNFYSKHITLEGGQVSKLQFSGPLKLIINGQEIDFNQRNRISETEGDQKFYADKRKTYFHLGYDSEYGGEGFGFSSRYGENFIKFSLNHNGPSVLKVNRGLDINSGQGRMNLYSNNGINMQAGNGFSLSSATGNLATGEGKDLSLGGIHNGVQITQGLFSPWAVLDGYIPSTKNSLELRGNIWATDFTFQTDPIYESNRLNSLIGGTFNASTGQISRHMTIENSKSLKSQLNEIYKWSETVLSWYKDYLAFKTAYNNYVTSANNKISTLQTKIATIGQDMGSIFEQLGNTSINPEERYGSINDEVTTKHEIINSSDFYDKAFIRDDNTVYFIIDDD